MGLDKHLCHSGSHKQIDLELQGKEPQGTPAALLLEALPLNTALKSGQGSGATGTLAQRGERTVTAQAPGWTAWHRSHRSHTSRKLGSTQKAAPGCLTQLYPQLPKLGNNQDGPQEMQWKTVAHPDNGLLLSN